VIGKAPPWPLFSAKAGPTNTIPDTARANGGTGRSHPVAIGHLQRSDLANRRQVLPSAAAAWQNLGWGRLIGIWHSGGHPR
jgi:hypothetical protein